MQFETNSSSIDSPGDDSLKTFPKCTSDSSMQGSQRYSSSSATGAGVPFHERKEYILGNLGFDTPGPELERRAREALVAARLPEPSDLRAVFAYGSSVRITWGPGIDVWGKKGEVRQRAIVHPESGTGAARREGKRGQVCMARCA